MKKLLALTACLSLSLVGAPRAQENAPGSIAGTVRYLGDLPEPQRIVTTDGAIIWHRDLVVDAKSRGLRQVSVLVENAPRQKPTTLVPLVMTQKDMLFLPRVIAVQEGRKVRFENDDLSNHAIQSMSTNPANVFNVTTPQGQPFEFAFESQKLPVVLGCPIHGWMRAYVFVHPHPYFAITDEAGRFRIDGLSAGEYFVLFRHPDTGLREKRVVSVEAGRTTSLDVEWRKVK